MTDAHDWLPADTPVPPALDRSIGETVAGWSAAWFAGAPAVAEPLAQARSRDVAWRSLDAGLMLGLGADAMAAVGTAAVDLPRADRSDADRDVLEAVAEECLAELRQRLAVMAGSAKDAGWAPSIVPPTRVATIAGGTMTALSIGLSDAGFARLAKAALPEPVQAPLGDGATALAASPVDIGAALGGVVLTLAELEALGIGDVVVLDHPVDQPAALTAGGVRLPGGRCSVAVAPAPVLQIIKPVA